MKNSLKITLALVLVLSLGGCGGTEALQSETLDREIIVDGAVEDWQGALTPIEKKNLSLGLLNDGEFLYVALVAREQQQVSQMMSRGFTVWFDAEGGKAKTFGIRFPLGLMASGAGFSPRARQEEQDPEARRQRFEESLMNMEIFDSEDHGMRFAVNTVQGIAVDATMEAGTLVYELQVPLRKTEAHAFAVGAAPGDVIGVGLETPEIDREAMRQQMGARGGGRAGPAAGAAAWAADAAASNAPTRSSCGRR